MSIATYKKESGVMLLEALIAILVFSMGILAIIGLQAASVQASTDAKYRSDASFLANQLIGQMWVSDRSSAALQNNFQGGEGTNGVAYTNWLANVQSAMPGVATNPPIVAITPIPSPVATSSRVTITIFWKLPGESALHQYRAIVQVI
jgi:type IV pilus assembly protein PilV